MATANSTRYAALRSPRQGRSRPNPAQLEIVGPSSDTVLPFHCKPHPLRRKPRVGEALLPHPLAPLGERGY
ncbi:hypothetical protein GMSM_34980 [Geomonas sp. Red276]